MSCLCQDLYDESQTRVGALERQLAALQVEDDDEDEADNKAESTDEDAEESAHDGEGGAAKGWDADEGGAVDEWQPYALR